MEVRFRNKEYRKYWETNRENEVKAKKYTGIEILKLKMEYKGKERDREDGVKLMKNTEYRDNKGEDN